MTEIWKPITGYVGRYEVSDLGRIKSITITGKEKILNPSKNSQGYHHMQLYTNGRRKILKVHRLVAIAFIDNPKMCREVNHKNGNKSDNRACNLEWLSPKGNTVHAHATGLVKKKIGAEHHRSKPVVVYDLSGNFVREYGSARQAEKDGYSKSSIGRACKNASIYKDYIWKYKDLIHA